jgi:arylsulfatase A-like enzyme
LEQNTIVIITSDHGEMFGEHGDFEHSHSLYAPLLYVPLLIRWPGKISGGLRVETPVSLTSLPATILSLISAGGPRPFPGLSMAPLWNEASPPADWPYPWAELAACPESKQNIPCHSGALKVIVTPDWYFIHHEKQPPQLYDAKKDRAQINNLAETPEGQEVVAEFLAQVRKKHTREGPGTNSAAQGPGN